MVLVTYNNHLTTVIRQLPCRILGLAHMRAGSIYQIQPFCLNLLIDMRPYAMGADNHRSLGNLIQCLNLANPFLCQPRNHLGVVNNRSEGIGPALRRHRILRQLDSPLDSVAKPEIFCQINFSHQVTSKQISK